MTPFYESWNWWLGRLNYPDKTLTTLEAVNHSHYLWSTPSKHLSKILSLVQGREEFRLGVLLPSAPGKPGQGRILSLLIYDWVNNHRYQMVPLTQSSRKTALRSSCVPHLLPQEFSGKHGTPHTLLIVEEGALYI